MIPGNNNYNNHDNDDNDSHNNDNIYLDPFKLLFIIILYMLYSAVNTAINTQQIIQVHHKFLIT